MQVTEAVAILTLAFLGDTATFRNTFILHEWSEQSEHSEMKGIKKGH